MLSRQKLGGDHGYYGRYLRGGDSDRDQRPRGQPCPDRPERDAFFERIAAAAQDPVPQAQDSLRGLPGAVRVDVCVDTCEEQGLGVANAA